MAVSVVDTIITAENSFTNPIDTQGETRVHITCSGDGAKTFSGTTVTIQAKPANWPDTQWVDIGTITSGDSDGQSQFIEVGTNLKVRAGVLTGNFSSSVAIQLAV